ncbi:MAG: metallophosphoesterase [Lachnospiraceae bacterium]|jgi:predicted MPP superfamily phosphohydrolase|nr:metallophosphoesterase [Lachnospiraceae bacterium]
MTQGLLFIGIVVVIGLLWIAIYDTSRFVIVHYTAKDPKIKKSFRVVLLSDLHNKQYGIHNSRLLHAIRSLSPNGILIAGDMVTATKSVQTECAMALLTELAKDYPIYYANGNHEQKLNFLTGAALEKAQIYMEQIHALSIHSVNNQSYRLSEQNIVISGLEMDHDYYFRSDAPKMDAAYLQGLLGESQQEQYHILLAHNPQYFPQYAEWGADLVLSGHIHGGIIRIPAGRGLLSPTIRFFPKYDGGLFEQGKSKMILSRGIGYHCIPFRLFNPSEIVVIDFRSSDQSEVILDK